MQLRLLSLLCFVFATSPLLALQPNIPAGTLLPGMIVQTRFGPMDCILSAPRPTVPPGHHIHGRGVYAIDIQVVSSFVPSVRVLQSCGDPELDRITVETLREWRFRPRTIYKLIVPIEFAGRRAILGGR
jgi:hypothetical protein